MKRKETNNNNKNKRCYYNIATWRRRGGRSFVFIIYSNLQNRQRENNVILITLNYQLNSTYQF